ncbi:hypothetical protein [Neobacillus drentensis]|jgi:hypothetical protein
MSPNSLQSKSDTIKLSEYIPSTKLEIVAIFAPITVRAYMRRT